MLLLRAGSVVKVDLSILSVFQVLLSRGTPVGSLGLVEEEDVEGGDVGVDIEGLDCGCG